MADGTWGDHVILHGAANCFRTCIHVISSLPHRYDVMVCPEFDVASSNRLVLGHLHELHYVSLIPQIGGKDVWLYCDSRRPYRHLSGTSDWTIIVVPYLKMLARNKTSIFSHVQFLIRQFSYDGTISRCNRLSIHNENIFCLKQFMQPPQFLR